MALSGVPNQCVIDPSIRDCVGQLTRSLFVAVGEPPNRTCCRRADAHSLRLMRTPDPKLRQREYVMARPEYGCGSSGRRCSAASSGRRNPARLRLRRTPLVDHSNYCTAIKARTVLRDSSYNEKINKFKRCLVF